MPLMTLQDVAKLAGEWRLEVFGAFHPEPGDLAPEGTGTLLLLGPREPGFWDHFAESPECRDGDQDPLDRWSMRAVSAIAESAVAEPLFPFGGPPYRPFHRWAIRSGRAWQSPVGMLVHDRAGLMASYRGALALGERLELPDLPNRPCDSCPDRPCETACPSGALGTRGYDVPVCREFLDSPDGRECMTLGCAVRRSCPVSRLHARIPEQSAFHMKAFRG